MLNDLGINTGRRRKGFLASVLTEKLWKQREGSQFYIWSSICSVMPVKILPNSQQCQLPDCWLAQVADAQTEQPQRS